MKRQYLSAGLYFVELPPRLIVGKGKLEGKLNFRWLDLKEEGDVTFPPAAKVEQVDYNFLRMRKEECKRVWEDYKKFCLEMKVEELSNQLKSCVQ